MIARYLTRGEADDCVGEFCIVLVVAIATIAIVAIIVSFMIVKVIVQLHSISSLAIILSILLNISSFSIGFAIKCLSPSLGNTSFLNVS